MGILWLLLSLTKYRIPTRFIPLEQSPLRGARSLRSRHFPLNAADVSVVSFSVSFVSWIWVRAELKSQRKMQTDFLYTEYILCEGGAVYIILNITVRWTWIKSEILACKSHKMCMHQVLLLAWFRYIVVHAETYFFSTSSSSFCVCVCVGVYVVMRLPSCALFLSHAVPCAPLCFFHFLSLTFWTIEIQFILNLLIIANYSGH